MTVLAGIGPDQAWAWWLALGMVATVNPCGFAMLPAYLSYFLGLEDSDAEVPQASVAQAVRVAGAVAAGFMAVFAVAGLAVRLTSLPVYELAPWISIVIGVVLLALGVAMLCGFEPTVRLPRLDRGGRERTVRSMFVFGVSYAIASIGCTLPGFLGPVAGTFNRESLLDGVLVFAVYGLGMALVLLALTVGIALARTSIVRSLRSVQPYIGRVSGGLVGLAGVYVAYYGWHEVRMAREGTVPDVPITDVVAGWSADATRWIQEVGSVRIAVVVVILVIGVVAGRPLPRTPGGSPHLAYDPPRSVTPADPPGTRKRGPIALLPLDGRARTSGLVRPENVAALVAGQ